MVASATAALSRAMATTLERRLGVRKRARADAGRPKIEEDGPAAAELEIAAAIDAERAPLLAERALIAAQLEQSLRRAAAPAPDFALTASQSLLPLRQVEARHRGELAALRARAASERADVETFRRREDRVFGAKLPDSSGIMEQTHQAPQGVLGDPGRGASGAMSMACEHRLRRRR